MTEKELRDIMNASKLWKKNGYGFPEWISKDGRQEVRYFRDSDDITVYLHTDYGSIHASDKLEYLELVKSTYYGNSLQNGLRSLHGFPQIGIMLE